MAVSFSAVAASSLLDPPVSRAARTPPFLRVRFALRTLSAPKHILALDRALPHGLVLKLGRSGGGSARVYEELFCVESVLVIPTTCTGEREVCTLKSEGLTRENIAIQLGLSLRTVNIYRHRSYSKLQITTDIQLFRLAVKHQLVQLER